MGRDEPATLAIRTYQQRSVPINPRADGVQRELSGEKQVMLRYRFGLGQLVRVEPPHSSASDPTQHCTKGGFMHNTKSYARF